MHIYHKFTVFWTVMNVGAGDCIISLGFIYTKNCKKMKKMYIKRY